MQTRENTSLESRPYRGENARHNEAIVAVFSVIAEFSEEEVDAILRGAKYEWQSMLAIERTCHGVPKEVVERAMSRMDKRRNRLSSVTSSDMVDDGEIDLLSLEDEDPPTLSA